MSDFFWGDFFSTNEKVVQDAFAKTKSSTLKVLKSATENLGLNVSGRTKEPYVTAITNEISNWIKEVNSIDSSLVVEYKNSIINHFKQGTKPMSAASFNNPIPTVTKEVKDDEILREEILKWILSSLESGKKTIKKKEFEEHIKKLYPHIANKTNVQEQLKTVSKYYTDLPSSERLNALRKELQKDASMDLMIAQRLKSEFGIETKSESEAIDTLFSRLKKLSQVEKELVEKLKMLQDQKQEIASQTKQVVDKLSENVSEIELSKVKTNATELSQLNTDALQNYNSTYFVANQVSQNSDNSQLKNISDHMIKDSENVSNAVNNIHLEAKNLTRNLDVYKNTDKKLRKEFSLQKIANNVENINNALETLDDLSLDDLDFDLSDSNTCNPEDVDKSTNESEILDAINCGDGLTCNTDTAACEPSKSDDDFTEISGRTVRLSGSKKSEVLIKIKKLIQKYKISNERQKIFNSQPIDVSGLARIQQDMSSHIDSAQYKLQFSRDEAREAFKQALLQ
jgi:hypothetical protein